MPILKPKQKTEKEQIRLSLEKNLLANINNYCEWANIKKIDDFFEQAAEFILKKDKEWDKYFRENIATKNLANDNNSISDEC